MTTLDPHIALACAVALSAVDDLKAHHRQREIDFFLDPTRSELWLVAAGLDYDATVSRLRRDGHFTPAPPPIKRKDFMRNLR